MIKHKHYDMIVAKAANMDLVLFVKCGKNDKWKESETPVCFPLSEFEDVDYFLCLPKHKEAVLNALSGGESEITYGEGIWSDCNCDVPVKWDSRYWYMVDGCESRIKPKKVKRWIGYCAKTNQTFPHPQPSKDAAINYSYIQYNYVRDDWQFIEIEVEE